MTKKFKLSVSGWITAEVKAPTPEEAVQKFCNEGLNGMNDAVVYAVDEVKS